MYTIRTGAYFGNYGSIVAALRQEWDDFRSRTDERLNKIGVSPWGYRRADAPTSPEPLARRIVDRMRCHDAAVFRLGRPRRLRRRAALTLYVGYWREERYTQIVIVPVYYRAGDLDLIDIAWRTPRRLAVDLWRNGWALPDNRSAIPPYLSMWEIAQICVRHGATWVRLSADNSTRFRYTKGPIRTLFYIEDNVLVLMHGEESIRIRVHGDSMTVGTQESDGTAGPYRVWRDAAWHRGWGEVRTSRVAPLLRVLEYFQDLDTADN